MSQLELKSQVTTQMVFTFLTAALSGPTVGTVGLLFLPTTEAPALLEVYVVPTGQNLKSTLTLKHSSTVFSELQLI